jgi:hypothetical protein
MALPDNYIQVPAQLPELFKRIADGQAPDKFYRQYLKDLGFLSSNYHAFIPLLKTLGFLTADGNANGEISFVSRFIPVSPRIGRGTLVILRARRARFAPPGIRLMMQLTAPCGQGLLFVKARTCTRAAVVPWYSREAGGKSCVMSWWSRCLASRWPAARVAIRSRS